MNFPKQQRGMSGSGWLLLIVVLSGLVSVGAKLAPHYFDFNTISQVLDAMTREQGLVNRSVPDIKAQLVKRLKLNSIRDFDFENRMVIKRASDRIIIDMKYEVRVKLVANLALVSDFEKKVELRN